MNLKGLIEKIGVMIRFKATGKVFYINGADTLPPPLTKEEEQKVFELMDTDFEKARE